MANSASADSSQPESQGPKEATLSHTGDNGQLPPALIIPAMFRSPMIRALVLP
jgi:hypothetical protein